MAEIVRRHVIVRGDVQGVGYRAWAEHTARGHGLQGWVRNRRDGTVEAVFAGSAEQVDAMIAACKRGPALAHPMGIDVKEGDEMALAQRRKGEAFSVLPTI